MKKKIYEAPCKNLQGKKEKKKEKKHLPEIHPLLNLLLNLTHKFLSFFFCTGSIIRGRKLRQQKRKYRKRKKKAEKRRNAASKERREVAKKLWGGAGERQQGMLLDTKCKKIYNARLIGRSTKSSDPFSNPFSEEPLFLEKNIPRCFSLLPHSAKTHLRACVLLFIVLLIILKYSYIYCFTN